MVNWLGLCQFNSISSQTFEASAEDAEGYLWLLPSKHLICFPRENYRSQWYVSQKWEPIKP